MLVLTHLAYKHLIAQKAFLLPDLNTLGNELWLAIGGYLYILADRVLGQDSKKAARSLRYIRQRYVLYKERYGEVVKGKAKNARMEALVFSVLIVEDFNRPRVYRWLERLAFRVGRAKSLGIMQVETNDLIDDEESVERGVAKLIADHARVVQEAAWKREPFPYETTSHTRQREEREIIHLILVRYNPSGDYAREVLGVLEILEKEYYPGAGGALHPEGQPETT